MKQIERSRTKLEWRKARKEKLKARKALLKESGQLSKTTKASKSNAESEGTIIFDFSYDDLMTEKERLSLLAQISRCYAINRRSDKPFNLHSMGVSSSVRQLLLQRYPDYPRWKNIVFDEETIEGAQLDLKKMVYLTADSNNILETIDRETTYIIGGLVDRNRHKVGQTVDSHFKGLLSR